jgi:enamine deaminase RidA (YjgF/YER057c/UK114 family)
MAAKQEIRTDKAPAPGGSYSQGLVAGDFLYTAGMGPMDPRTGEVVGDDVASQTRQVLDNLRAVLAAHVGSDLLDILAEIDLVAYLGRAGR